MAGSARDCLVWVLAIFLGGLAGLARAQGAPPDIAVGARHTCAVDSRGRAMCWGSNISGAVGDGSVTAGAKVDVIGLASGASKVSAGFGSACALLESGGVRCWGDNTFGQLGDGTQLERARAVDVLGLASGAAAVQAGRFSCALTSQGGVRCWGATTQYGGSTSGTPEDVPGLASGVAAIAGSGGANHYCVLTSAGGVKCFGGNYQGQLGNGAIGGPTSPVDVAGLASGVTAVAVGYNHSCALTSAGGVRCWGANESGQLGDGTQVARSSPVNVSGLASGVTAIAAGGRNSCALLSDGTVKCWGDNHFGQASSASVDQVLLPTQVGNVSSILRLSVGSGSACALASSGSLLCWGDNQNGQLGDGTTYGAGGARAVTGLAGAIRDFSMGEGFACAVLSTGAVKCWGYNATSQLGNDTLNPYNVPVTVSGLASGVRAIDVGYSHSCALMVSGGVKCWGDNFYGQRGDTSLDNPNPVGTPRDVVGLSAAATRISVHDGSGCALLANGAVQCWGGGAGTISGLPPNVTRIAVGSGFGCAVGGAGGVRCWGSNTLGSLGNGTTAFSQTAVDVIGLQAGAVSIAAGVYHACALMATGVVKCWGGNVGGSLGDGTTTNRATPVDVLGLPADVMEITSKMFTTCALTRSGAVWCWGGDFPSRAVAVEDLQSGVTAVRASGRNVCVIVTGGGMACQGENNFGQVGDGTLVARRERVTAVVGLDRRSFLDLTPDDPLGAEKQPSFVAVATGTGTNVTATIQYRAQDIGTSGSVYVFALSPPDRVVGAVSEKSARFGALEKGEKDTPVQCVLAQLNAAGQLKAVSASSLQAYVSGVLSGQGQAVTILNGVPAATIGGATFFVGYGPNAASMLANGTNRGVVSVAGATQCAPRPPQTGWWWNTAEGGRGYSIEASGNKIFFAAYLYDVSGRATWTIAAGNTSLDGALFQGRLESYSGGQSLAGPYRAPGPVSHLGDITLAFTDAAHGTMIWPGGSVAIERFNIVPNGLTTAPLAGLPQGGWWWNPGESGRGYFLEWQGNTLFMAGYMYDDAGNPIWYLTSNASSNPQGYSNTWWQYGNGQTLTGAYRPAQQVSNNVGPVTIQFQGAETGIMTLPGNRTIPITRYRF